MKKIKVTAIVKRVRFLYKELVEYINSLIRKYFGRKSSVVDNTLKASMREYGSERKMEMLLRQIVSEMGMNVMYNDSLYGIMLEYIEALTDLQRVYGTEIGKPLSVFLEKHKNVSRETLIKFINEERFPDKYNDDMAEVYKEIFNIKVSKSIIVPCIHKNEIKRLPIGLADVIMRNNLYADTRKRKIDSRQYAKIVYEVK